MYGDVRACDAKLILVSSNISFVMTSPLETQISHGLARPDVKSPTLNRLNGVGPFISRSFRAELMALKRENFPLHSIPVLVESRCRIQAFFSLFSPRGTCEATLVS